MNELTEEERFALEVLNGSIDEPGKQVLITEAFETSKVDDVRSQSSDDTNHSSWSPNKASRIDKFEAAQRDAVVLASFLDSIWAQGRVWHSDMSPPHVETVSFEFPVKTFVPRLPSSLQDLEIPVFASVEEYTVWLASRLVSSENKLQSVSTELSNINSRCVILQNERNELFLAIEERDEEISRLKDLLAQKDAPIQNINFRFDSDARHEVASGGSPDFQNVIASVSTGLPGVLDTTSPRVRDVFECCSSTRAQLEHELNRVLEATDQAWEADSRLRNAEHSQEVAFLMESIRKLQEHRHSSKVGEHRIAEADDECNSVLEKDSLFLELSALKEAYCACKDELDVLRDDNERLRMELDAVSEYPERCEVEQARVGTIVADVQEERDELLSELHQHAVLNGTVMQRCCDLEEEISDLVSERDALVHKIATLQRLQAANSMCIAPSHDQQLVQLENELDELRELYGKACAELQTSQATALRAEQCVAEKERVLSLLEEQNIALCRMTEEQGKTIANKEDACKQVELDAKISKEYCQRLAGQFQNLSDRYESLEAQTLLTNSELCALRAENQMFKKLHQDIVAALKVHQSALDVCEKSILESALCLQAKNMEISQLTCTLELVVGDHCSIGEEKNAKIASLHNAITEVVRAAEEKEVEIARLATNLQIAQKALEAEANALKRKQDEVVRLKDTMDDLSRVQKENEQEIAQLRSTTDTYSVALWEKSGELEKITRNCTELQIKLNEVELLVSAVEGHTLALQPTQSSTGNCLDLRGLNDVNNTLKMQLQECKCEIDHLHGVIAEQKTSVLLKDPPYEDTESSRAHPSLHTEKILVYGDLSKKDDLVENLSILQQALDEASNLHAEVVGYYRDADHVRRISERVQRECEELSSSDGDRPSLANTPLVSMFSAEAVNVQLHSHCVHLTQIITKLEAECEDALKQAQSSSALACSLQATNQSMALKLTWANAALKDLKLNNVRLCEKLKCVKITADEKREEVRTREAVLAQEFKTLRSALQNKKEQCDDRIQEVKALQSALKMSKADLQRQDTWVRELEAKLSTLPNTDAGDIDEAQSQQLQSQYEARTTASQTVPSADEEIAGPTADSVVPVPVAWEKELLSRSTEVEVFRAKMEVESLKAHVMSQEVLNLQTLNLQTFLERLEKENAVLKDRSDTLHAVMMQTGNLLVDRLQKALDKKALDSKPQSIKEMLAVLELLVHELLDATVSTAAAAKPCRLLLRDASVQVATNLQSDAASRKVAEETFSNLEEKLLELLTGAEYSRVELEHKDKKILILENQVRVQQESLVNLEQELRLQFARAVGLESQLAENAAALSVRDDIIREKVFDMAKQPILCQQCEEVVAKSKKGFIEARLEQHRFQELQRTLEDTLELSAEENSLCPETLLSVEHFSSTGDPLSTNEQQVRRTDGLDSQWQSQRFGRLEIIKSSGRRGGRHNSVCSCLKETTNCRQASRDPTFSEGALRLQLRFEHPSGRDEYLKRMHYLDDELTNLEGRSTHHT